MTRRGRVVNYAGNSQARDMNGNRTQNWRIEVHHHVVPPQFADNSMPIKIQVDFYSLLPNACCLVPILVIVVRPAFPISDF